MSEIRLRIMGGLGNQLFQYTAARYIQKKYGINNLVIESKEYQTYKIRNLEICNFALPEFVTETQKATPTEEVIRSIYRVYQKLFLVKNKRFAPQKETTIGRTKYICSTTEFKMPKIKPKHDVFMNGYFVSAEIAQLMRKDLLNEIILIEQSGENYKSYKRLINNSTSIGISIRCGDDYVKAGWPICSKEFYISGLNKLISKFSDSLIFIFSDDVDRVRDENWFADFSNVVFVENVNVCESFDLLRRCNHYVCANSSFSWWAAFLTYSDSPLIYEPNLFYSERYNDTERLKYDGVKYLHYQSGVEI